MFADSSHDFFINLLEKGGLPALALGVFFTVFFFWIRSVQKQGEMRDQSTKQAFEALQKEREIARSREAEQYHELMQSYAGLVSKFIDLSSSSTRAITTLGERVGQCPLRDHPTEVLRDGVEDRDD